MKIYISYKFSLKLPLRILLVLCFTGFAIDVNAQNTRYSNAIPDTTIKQQVKPEKAAKVTSTTNKIIPQEQKTNEFEILEQQQNNNKIIKKPEIILRKKSISQEMRKKLKEKINDKKETKQKR